MRIVIAVTCIAVIASYGILRENTNKDKDLAWLVSGVKKIIHVGDAVHGHA